MSRIAAIRAAAKGARASAGADQSTPDDDIEEDDGATPPPKSKRKEDDMAEADTNAAVETAKKEGHDAGFKAANDRINKVFASEHYAGREAMAAKLLGKPSMSAEDIIDVLADTPKAESTALTEEQQRQAAEEGGRKEMQDALGQQQNSNIDAGGDKADQKADDGAIWDRAIELNNPGPKKS